MLLLNLYHGQFIHSLLLCLLLLTLGLLLAHAPHHFEELILRRPEILAEVPHELVLAEPCEGLS